MKSYIEKLYELMKKEFKTDLGRYNIFSSILICSFFGGIHSINSIRQLVYKLLHEDISLGNGDKFFYYIIIYFIISLTLLAFKRDN